MHPGRPVRDITPNASLHSLQECNNCLVTETPTLRERRRTETWNALHDAAAELVLEHGLGAVSIDRITEAAGVSPRTFFNYFPSKQAAVLGVRDPHLPDCLLDDFDPAGDLVTQTTHLLLAVLRTATPHEDVARRRQLTAAHPELQSLRMHAVEEARRLLAEALTERLADHQLVAAADAPAEELVSLLVTAAAAVLQHAHRHPVAGSRTAGALLTEADVDHALEFTHHLWRNTL